MLNTNNDEQLNVFAINAYGHIEPIDHLLQTKYFTGIMTNTKWNHTINIYSSGIIDIEKDMISLIIFTDSDEFYITPAISFDENFNSHFIIDNNPTIPHSLISNIFQLNRRHRRHSSNNKIRYCGIKLTIDYDLYEKFNFNPVLTVQHSQFVIRFVNQIFFQTKWSENGYDNSSHQDQLGDFGIVPCVILIETEQQQQQKSFYSLKLKYDSTEKNMNDYIESISDNNYCLSHVFTNIKINETNGFTKNCLLFADINGGLSSFAHCENPWEIYCILSAVHEFGHNFCSTHDTDDCMPNEGGTYIMSYPFNSEKGPNNFKFSPCSIRAIYRYVKEKEQRFIEMLLSGSCQNKNKCGNRIIEGDEKCDEGPNGGNCCDKNCNLKTLAKCSQSQTNALCCNEKCEIRKKGEHCLPEDKNFCLTHSECDGNSYLCSDRKKLPDNTPCGDKYLDGICLNGHCKMCTRYIEECHFCCLDKTNKTCKPNRMLAVNSNCQLKNTSIPGQCDSQGVCQDLNSIIYFTEPTSTQLPTERKTLGPSILEIIAIVITFTMIILLTILALACSLADKNLYDEYDGESKEELINYRKR
ncbi:ADAM 17-like protein protease-like protein, partial [Euroglyphus maynei]